MLPRDSVHDACQGHSKQPARKPAVADTSAGLLGPQRLHASPHSTALFRSRSCGKPWIACPIMACTARSPCRECWTAATGCTTTITPPPTTMPASSGTRGEQGQLVLQPACVECICSTRRISRDAAHGAAAGKCQVTAFASSPTQAVTSEGCLQACACSTALTN